MSDLPHRRLRAQTTVAALASLVLILAACSSNASPSQGAGSEPPTSQAPASQAAGSQAPASQPAAGGTTVTLSGLAFSVAEITIPVGSLTFVNQDSVAHILAEGENGVEVASPRVQKVSISPNSQGDLVFTVAGDYHITCTIHKTMNMEVHVQ